MTEISEPKFASFPRRMAAFLLDLLIVFVPCVLFSLAVTFATALLTDKGLISLIELSVQVIVSLVPALYGACFESSVFQATPGKMLLKIRVTDMEGKRCRFLRALARNLAFGISDLSFGIGYLAMLFSARKQCIHDRISNCLVISS